MSESADHETHSTSSTTPHEALTNTLRPLTDVFLTIRIIKSFTYRTTKNLLLPHIDATTMTVGGLKELCRAQVLVATGFKPFRTTVLDTLKLYTVAHGAKTTNLIINFDNDENWILNDDSATLASIGIENEAELSFFNRELYEAFKKDPTQSW
ncbi:BQ5605_C019g08998 [Microbotryum silenes-dioicae]|uniref:BQ5605_C019g08998 protein n=1 Tax=Microbotryum silenes-dioicae TaxID=796604 RepID=A0A2X0NU54_9BASI|nr:BQ5605_C019g08998 [Microbotryum silenes-dioicae]